MMDRVVRSGGDTPLLQTYPPLLRNRNFILLWLGYVISALGDRIHFVVMLQLVSNLMARKLGQANYEAGTQESAQLTVMMLAPFLLWGPVTGIMADRFSRRVIMVVSDLARVAIVIVARTLFLRETGHLSVMTLYAMLLGSEFVLASFASAFTPARLALLPQLVHPGQLLRANSMTNAAGTIASLIGFVLGGALVKWHLGYAMFMDAGTFMGSAVCLMLMRKVPGVAASPENRQGAWRELVQGLSYIKHHRRVLQIIMLMFIFWSCGTIILNGLTGIVTHGYGLTIDKYAYFMGVVGVGMIVGAASVSLAKRGVPKEVGIGWAMMAVGVFLLFFSLARTWQMALPFLVVAAAAGAVLLVSLDTLLQRIVPNYVRGRVMAAKDIISTCGLISVAIVLAFWTDVDEVIRLLLMGLSVFVVCVGLFLLLYYNRGRVLPWKAMVALRFARAVVMLWHRYERVGACTIPGEGPVIVVANHSTAIDPVVMMCSSPRRIVHFMMAKEYYEIKWFNWLYRIFGVIPVNRSGNDTASIRAVLRLLEQGKCVGLFPEGGISESGEIREARQGVALFVLKSGATVVPAYIAGVHVHRGMVSDFTRRARIRVRYGAPLRFTKDEEKARDEGARAVVTERIMGAIAALRDKARAAGEDVYKVGARKEEGGERRMTKDE